MSADILRSCRDCQVAVVGGAGFLGSHMVRYLIEERNCDVLVIDNFSVGNASNVHLKAECKNIDIRQEYTRLVKALETQQTKFVFNYAACPYLPMSYDLPYMVLQTNLMGALSVFLAAEAAGCEGILQVTSAEVYDQPGAASEDESPATARSTYGISKLAADYLVQVRWREAQTPVVGLRQFNCVGENETHPYVVPEIISQLSKQKDAGVAFGDYKVQLGNNSSRDFLYAGDAVRMAVELMEKGKFGEVYNLGSESTIQIYELAQRIGQLMGCGDVTIVPDKTRARKWEIWHIRSDNSKTYKTIMARPRVNLDEALLRTIRYHEDNGKRWCWEK